MSAGNSYALAAAELYRQIGQAQAMRAFGRANAFSDATRSIPANAAGLVQNHDQRADRAQTQEMRDLQIREAQRAETQQVKDFADQKAIRDIFSTVPALDDGTPDYSTIANKVSTIDPMKGAQLQQIGDAQRGRVEQIAQKRAQDIARELGNATATTWTDAVERLKGKGIDVSGIPPTYDAGFQKDAVEHAMAFDSWMTQRFAKKPTREVKTRDADGNETTRIVEDTPGQTFTSAPEKKPLTFDKDVQIVDGRRQNVLIGSDGNWYFPGDTKKAIANTRVKPVPEKPAAGSGITQAQRSEAERWKTNELQTLEKEFTTSRSGGGGASMTSPDGTVINLGGSGSTKTPMTDQQLSSRKLQIENTYRRTIGLQPVSELPAEWGAKPAGAGAPKQATPVPANATVGMMPPDSASAAAPGTDRSQWDARPDGTAKGDGFLGVLQRPDGQVASEYSVSTDRVKDASGKEIDFPTLVPTLTKAEVQTVLNLKEGQVPPASIIRKAEAFALARLKAGKPVFAQPGEQQVTLHPDLPRVAVTGAAAGAPPAAATRGPAAAPTAGGQPIVVKMPNGPPMQFTPEQYAEFVKRAEAAGYAIK